MRFRFVLLKHDLSHRRRQRLQQPFGYLPALSDGALNQPQIWSELAWFGEQMR